MITRNDSKKYSKEFNKEEIIEKIINNQIGFIKRIVVGRDLEKDTNKLNILKDKFPLCYIANLDGKVIL